MGNSTLIFSAISRLKYHAASLTGVSLHSMTFVGIFILLSVSAFASIDVRIASFR
jgi:hypothetical protein